MNVTDELRELELYFEDEDSKEQKGQGKQYAQMTDI